MTHELDEKALAAATREYLNQKGERPDRILRSGHSLLEANLPAFREAITAYLASLPSPESAAQQPATEAVEPLSAQIDRLANFIMAEVPGEPSQSEGAVDTAIRWMRAALSGEKK